MDAYAVIETGGKQYYVKANDTLKVERLAGAVGDQVAFDRVLALSDGNSLQVGAPTVPGATVTYTVVDHIRGEKVVSFKKKRRQGYKRKQGHRQELTVVRVASVA